MALFKMTRASGHALNIPPHAIQTLESVRKGKNAQHPEAKSFIRYDLGGGPSQALLQDDFDDLLKRLHKAHPPAKDWISFSIWQAGQRKLTPKQRDRIYMDRGRIVGIEGLDPDLDGNDGALTMLHVTLGHHPIRLATFDPPEEIEALVEPEAEEESDEVSEVQPSRRARVAAPKPGGKPRPARAPAAVPVPAKGPRKPTGAKKSR